MKLIENFNVARKIDSKNKFISCLFWFFSSAFNKNTHEYVEHNELYIAAIFFNETRFFDSFKKKILKRKK